MSRDLITNNSIMNPEKKSALIVEGGGLRGAYVVGVLRVLHEFGGARQFDSIYAVSSGVFAATYFATDQVEEMESTWRNLVHGSRLVKYVNILKRKPVLDLDGLINMFQGKVKLDLARVYSCKSKIIYVATETDTGRPHYFNAKQPDIFDMMRASSALPCVYSIPVIINGKRFEDGGHSDPIPIVRAIEDGHTDILVILTRPAGYVKPKNPVAIARLCLRRSPATMNAFLSVHSVYNHSMSIVEGAANNDVRIRTVRPSYMNVSRLTRDRRKIIAAIDQGKSDAAVAFEDMPRFSLGD